MKLTVSQPVLLRHTSLAAKATSKLPGSPLAGILINAEEKKVIIRSTDLQSAVTTSFGALAVEAGKVLVPGKLLVEILKLLPESESVTLQKEAGQLKLTAGDNTYHLNLLDENAFSPLPDPTGKKVSVERETFLQLSDRVCFAAAKDDTRPLLTGVRIVAKNDRLTMVATDSFRMVHSWQDVESAPDIDVVIPARALQEISKIASEIPSQTIDLQISDSQAFFTINTTIFLTRLLAGQFPDHEKLIPSSFEANIWIDRQEAIERLTRLKLFTGRSAPLKVELSHGLAKMSVSTAELGQAEETMEIEYDGEEQTVAFNCEYFREGLDALSGDKVNLFLNGAQRPALLQGDETEFRYLLMPVRLGTT